VPRGRAQCVPKWRIPLTFAQVRAVPTTVCKPSAKPTQVRILDLLPLAEMQSELGRPRSSRDLASPPNGQLNAALGARKRVSLPKFARSRI